LLREPASNEFTSIVRKGGAIPAHENHQLILMIFMSFAAKLYLSQGLALGFGHV
jgi:hypothetical protein